MEVRNWNKHLIICQVHLVSWDFLYPREYNRCPKCINIPTHVEIKCQLVATDEFLLQILLLAQYVSGTIMPIIRSPRVLYKWLLPAVFGAWFSGCRCGVELRVVCPVCGLLRYSPHNGARNMLSKQ